MGTPGSAPRFRLFAAGLVVIALFGAAHLAGHLAGPPTPATEDEATLLRLMSTVRRPPIDRTMMEIVDGFSLFLSAAPWLLAAIGLALRPLARANPVAMRRVIAVYALGVTAFLVISMVYWFLAPTAMLAGAAILLWLSAALEGRRARSLS